MKTITQHLLTFSYFLMTLTFSLQTYAQITSGPPIIRTETHGGGTGGENICISDNGEDFTLSYSVVFTEENLPFLETCDLHIGYDLFRSIIDYIEIPAVDFEQNPFNLNEYIYSFDIVLTTAEISEMCEENINSILLTMFCLENGTYTTIRGEDYPLEMCCAEGSNLYSNEKIQTFILDTKEDSEYTEKMDINQFSDYYIYDLQGNQIVILQNKSTKISIQEHISNLNIQTGIYLVRFWNGTDMKTIKVFKL